LWKQIEKWFMFFSQLVSVCQTWGVSTTLVWYLWKKCCLWNLRTARLRICCIYTIYL
jgi:hypothetical protein